MALPQDVDLASYNEMLVRALTDSRVEVLELKDEIDDLKIEIFTLNLTIEFLEKENSALRTSYGLSQ